ncbi:EamA family transporter [Candidatus Bathyarchaeota archaeon]|nr:EamA family transporter [Candidatus Bathyarchaeota archaeon]
MTLESHDYSVIDPAWDLIIVPEISRDSEVGISIYPFESLLKNVEAFRFAIFIFSSPFTPVLIESMRKIILLKLLLAVNLWGTTFSISKGILGRHIIDVFTLITFRMIFGFITMLLFLIGLGKTKEIKPMVKRNWKWLVFIGTVSFGVAYIIQYIPFQYDLTTTVNQSILLNFQVFFVIIINFLVYKKRASSMVILGAFIGFVGIVFLNLNESFGFSFETIWGDLLTILSCFFWGTFTAFSKPICEQEDNDPLVFNTIIIFIAMCALLPVAIISPRGFSKIGMLTGSDWTGILWLGIACVAVPYVMWFTALKEVESAKVAIFVYLEPIFAIMIAVIFIPEESITIFTIIGMILCFCGVFIAEWEPGNKNLTVEPEGSFLGESSKWKQAT